MQISIEFSNEDEAKEVLEAIRCMTAGQPEDPVTVKTMLAEHLKGVCRNIYVQGKAKQAVAEKAKAIDEAAGKIF